MIEKAVLDKIVSYNFSRPAVLCSVLEWKGSVPRKDYPVMVALDTGSIIGTIGGGTMEKEVIQLALESVIDGQIRLGFFDFTNDDISKDGGLCGGTTSVSIEPFTKNIQSFIEHVYSDRSIKCWQTTYHIQSNTVTRDILDLARMVHDKNSQGAINKDTSERTDEYLRLTQFKKEPAILHIFGAGHVGKAVADLAYFVGLDTTAHDDRGEFVTRERFPYSIRLSHDSVTQLKSKFEFGENDMVLVATRGHHHDFALIDWLLTKNLGWIGLVSSKRKWTLLAQGLKEHGYTEKDLLRVHAPVGIEIDAQTVPEIAVSIMGGIIKYLHHE